MTKSKLEPMIFPTMVTRMRLTKHQFKKTKISAWAMITLLVSNDLVDLMVEHTDPTDVWRILGELFEAGDPSQVLMVTGQLHSLRMIEVVYQEGTRVEESTNCHEGEDT